MNDSHTFKRYAERLSALGMVLHGAEAAGLPAPSIVSSIYGSGSPDREQTLHVNDARAFALWCEWTDAHYAGCDTTKDGKKRCYTAHGEAFELRVEIVLFEEITDTGHDTGSGLDLVRTAVAS